jgi:aminoglycoside phosphotransferase (APT) family kinase protein
VFELSVDNARGYAVERGLIADGEAVETRDLAGGVSNAVVMLATPDGGLVLKQPYQRLRVAERWEIDRERVWHEVAAIRAWSQILGDGWAPTILHEDRENYLYAMSRAPQEARNWKEILLGGDAASAPARRAGSALGKVHRLTTGQESIARAFPHHEVFVQGRVDPYFGPVIAAGGPLAGALRDLSERLLARRTALVHGDFSPKNILVTDERLFLIDFEIGHYGDPAFDAGFMLCHLLLKAVHRYRERDRYFGLAREFWRSYRARFGEAAPPDIESSTVGTLGGLLIARVDGKSPAEYIADDARRGAVRGAAARLLLGGVATVEEAIEAMDHELEGMESQCPPSHP